MAWTDTLAKVGSYVVDNGGELTKLGKMASLGGGILLNKSGLADPNIPTSGYQGGIPNLDFNREQLPVVPRDYTQDNFGRDHFTRGEFNPAKGQGSIINADAFGAQNVAPAGYGSISGGGNGILGTGISGGDLLTGGLTALSLNELTNGALFDYAGKGINAVGGGLKAGANALGIGGAPSGIPNASANIANFLPANPIGAIPTAAFDMAVGGANAASGIAGVEAASQTAANLGGNIAAFGADKAASTGYGSIVGNSPAAIEAATFDMASKPITNATIDAIGPEVASKVGLKIGALPTAAQVAYLTPYFLAARYGTELVGKHIIKPIARGVFGFGSEETKKGKELSKFAKESGLNKFKNMATDSMGIKDATYQDYIESQRPPTSPFDAEMAAIGDAGDRDYEEEQVVNMFQTPQGKAQMAKYYADNPKFFTPEGKRIFPESDMGDLQRASAAYNEQPIFGRDMRTGVNPMSEYITNVMNKDDYGRIMGKPRFMNAGGIVGNNPNPNGYFLGGITDGMTDEIPASINGEQPAALSDGEFVIPADVVSHFGNGNSNAGAKLLEKMMAEIRDDSTGSKKQRKQINPQKYISRLG